MCNVQKHFPPPEGIIPPFPEIPINPDPLLMGLRVFFRSCKLVTSVRDIPVTRGSNMTQTHSRCQGLMENVTCGLSSLLTPCFGNLSTPGTKSGPQVESLFGFNFQVFGQLQTFCCCSNLKVQRVRC